MSGEYQTLRIGQPTPESSPSAEEHSGGDVCDACGGGECGLHPKGCIYGGFGVGYWMIADGCELNHD